MTFVKTLSRRVELGLVNRNTSTSLRPEIKAMLFLSYSFSHDHHLISLLVILLNQVTSKNTLVICLTSDLLTLCSILIYPSLELKSIFTIINSPWKLMITHPWPYLLKVLDQLSFHLIKIKAHLWDLHRSSI